MDRLMRLAATPSSFSIERSMSTARRNSLAAAA
jgi:hypothetical protein